MSFDSAPQAQTQPRRPSPADPGGDRDPDRLLHRQWRDQLRQRTTTRLLLVRDETERRRDRQRVTHLAGWLRFGSTRFRALLASFRSWVPCIAARALLRPKNRNRRHGSGVESRDDSAAALVPMA